MSDFFGERIQEERKRLKLNQTEFASIAGVVLNTQFTYEKNTRTPDANYLRAIAAAGADVYYILTGARTPTIPATTSPDESALL
ncbi:MAG: helix-turn-helix domain-containing protein, partial [Magnetococcus sp. YQC-9]